VDAIKKIILLLVLLKVVALFNAWADLRAASATLAVPERPPATQNDRPAVAPTMPPVTQVPVDGH
jgi:hypothetical protein